MDKFLIKGPSILKGEVLISGSKNAALPILARIGNAAFLLPEIKTSPFKILGPLIKNLSINYFIFAT